MTKLEFIKEKVTEENGGRETAKLYAIGHYEIVTKHIVNIEKGYGWKTVDVRLNEETAQSNWNRETYYPCIYAHTSISSGKVEYFSICTTSYGYVKTDIAEKVIAGLNEAIEVVKVLEQNFIG